MSNISQIDQSLVRAGHEDCTALGTLHYRAHAISFKDFANRDWIDSRALKIYERYWCDYLAKQHEDERTWKVELRDQVAGTVSVVPLLHSSVAFRPRTIQHISDEKVACLRLMYVDPQVQGQGIGKALMKRALQFMRSNQARVGSLITHAANETARSFYEGAGWVLDEIFTAQISDFFPEPDDMKVRARYWFDLDQQHEG